MNYKYDAEFRKAKPETIGEKDHYFDLDNYKDFLESRLEKALDGDARREEECFVIQSLHKTWYDAKLLLDKDTLGDMERSNFEYERDFAKKLIDRLTRP